MSRFILLAALLAGLHHTADAQAVRGYGFKAGVASTNVEFNDDVIDGQVRRYGVTLSGFVEWLDHPNVSVVTELAYMEKGYGQEGESRDAQNNPAGTHTFAIQVNYLSAVVPLKVRYDSGPVSPFVSFGPRLNLKVGGNPSGFPSFEQGSRSTAFGWTAAAGFEIERTDRVDVIAELAYSRDETNALQENPLSRTAYHSEIALMIGLRF